MTPHKRIRQLAREIDLGLVELERRIKFMKSNCEKIQKLLRKLAPDKTTERVDGFRSGTKMAKIVAMLSRPGGAQRLELMELLRLGPGADGYHDLRGRLQRLRDHGFDVQLIGRNKGWLIPRV
jgi:hypothetical protein